VSWRQIPILPTLLVLAAAGVMVALGFWQLDRKVQKEALIARYQSAIAMNSEAAFPPRPDNLQADLYRHASVECTSVGAIGARAGHNAQGRTGWAHVARCITAGGNQGDVVLGWSDYPASPIWKGGSVRGTIAPGPRLVADPPLAGLAANARPDPRDMPNNHLAYAVQWFLFALTALVIYALALRKRLAAPGGEG
jgi:surfeit locus 1 family protein